MARILDTTLDIATMTMQKRVVQDDMLSPVFVLCRVPDIASAQSPDIDAALLAHDWSSAHGVHVIDFQTLSIKPQGLAPSVHHQWDWDALAWVDARTLDELKAAKSAEVDGSCRAQIMSGFESAALGALHHYPAKDRDQANLAASVLASMYPGIPADWTTPFWCADANGVWAFRQHTAAQIQQVGMDGKQAILAALSKNAVLQEQIAAAQTPDEVAAIVW